MRLTPGSRLGAFEIRGSLGAGGMGEVYRARDTKLNRDVALKVLPDSFASDPDRLARFTREAQTLASLNHPNIAHVYGIEESDGVRALVMELVEGDDLSQRIARGALPVDDVLPIAKQIADALEAAHEQGIIHRDLKPANIKVRPDGTVKVLDFGLAKAMDPTGVPRASASQLPTITTPAMTVVGVILGTAAYMSPEQARGKPVDKRADVWAFGAVLYEMLTGQRAFAGAEVSDVLASVLAREPDWTLLPRCLSPTLISFIKRCLHKDPKQRVPDIATMRLALDGVFDTASSLNAGVVTVARPMRAWVVPFAIGAAFAGVALITLEWRSATPDPVMQTVRLGIPFPSGMLPTSRSIPAISPDGRLLAFIPTAASDGERRLWVRPMDSLEARPLAGTEGAWGSPFWSPDSRFLVYLDMRVRATPQLRRIPVRGGPSQLITDAPTASARGEALLRGGFWTDDGQIVFPRPPEGLFRVPAAGGVPVPLTTTNTQGSHNYPIVLPDGRHFLYEVGGNTARPGVGGIYVGRLDSASAEQPHTRILPDHSNVAFVPGLTNDEGFLLFAREGTLVAQAFDSARLEVTGEPYPIATRLAIANPDKSWLFSAARNGTVVYQQEGFFENELHLWMDRGGKPIQKGRESGFYGGVWLAPDGKRFAYQRRDGQHEDLWLADPERPGGTRLTSNGTANFSATWSPDGTEVLFASLQGGPESGIYKKRLAGGKEELILDVGIPLDWSSDGRSVLFTRGGDLWATLEGASPNGKVVQLTSTEFSETVGRFSTDGRWLAYESDETGQLEIYVAPLVRSSSSISLGPKIIVSADGGTDPEWRSDGRELFYISPDQRIMSVSVDSGSAAFRAAIPRALFVAPGAGTWDVSPDGSRFLFTTLAGPAEPPPFAVLLNWRALIDR